MKIKPDCVFCNRIQDKRYDYTDATGVISFEPLNPVTPGHRLFVPEMHLLDAADSPVISGLVFVAAAMFAESNLNPKVGMSFNLITSAGRPATQSIFHMHVHYVPRFREDGLHLPWTPLASH